MTLAILLVPGVLLTRTAQAQTYSETILHSFTNTPDAAYPTTESLVADAQGNLYGTTEAGGASSNGTVFKVGALGNETILYSFTGLNGDGQWPVAGVTLDAEGNLYGTTGNGGNPSCGYGCGTVFALDPAGKEVVRYAFTGGADGFSPVAGLVRDLQGNMYGTTAYGGNCSYSAGCGVVFKLDSSGHLTVLHTFTGLADGAYPYAGLVRDTNGNLYGTTVAAGDDACNSQSPTPGCGIVFKVDANGNLTALHTFSGPPDGEEVGENLTLDAKGNVYGAASSGGTSPLQAGIVFKLAADGKETVLHNFSGGSDGQSPNGGLVFDARGILYGTTMYGGAFDKGTVFKISRGGKETVLHSFGAAGDGTYPWGGLVLDADGNLYGTTYSGGASNFGTLFKLTLQAATAVTLASSPNPSTYGQPVTFIATVTSTKGAPPDGEAITFLNGKTVLGTGTLAGGSAGFTTSALRVGSTSVTAMYEGDSNFASSKSKPVKQVVEKSER
jgi:uncharacterized repeat protein (TIGR03803 family)